jgi:hypothetical protein
VTLAPPSLIGGCQETTADVLKISEMVGVSGGPGLSGTDTNIQ